MEPRRFPLPTLPFCRNFVGFGTGAKVRLEGKSYAEKESGFEVSFLGNDEDLILRANVSFDSKGRSTVNINSRKNKVWSTPVQRIGVGLSTNRAFVIEISVAAKEYVMTANSCKVAEFRREPNDVPRAVLVAGTLLADEIVIFPGSPCPAPRVQCPERQQDVIAEISKELKSVNISPKFGDNQGQYPTPGIPVSYCAPEYGTANAYYQNFQKSYGTLQSQTVGVSTSRAAISIPDSPCPQQFQGHNLQSSTSAYPGFNSQNVNTAYSNNNNKKGAETVQRKRDDNVISQVPHVSQYLSPITQIPYNPHYPSTQNNNQAAYKAENSAVKYVQQVPYNPQFPQNSNSEAAQANRQPTSCTASQFQGVQIYSTIGSNRGSFDEDKAIGTMPYPVLPGSEGMAKKNAIGCRDPYNPQQQMVQAYQRHQSSPPNHSYESSRGIDNCPKCMKKRYQRATDCGYGQRGQNAYGFAAYCPQCSCNSELQSRYPRQQKPRCCSAQKTSQADSGTTDHPYKPTYNTVYPLYPQQQNPHQDCSYPSNNSKQVVPYQQLWPNSSSRGCLYCNR